MFPIPKVEISGETAKPIVDAVIDVFSPATELLGWLGDSIRVHRARTVLKCFARTKKIATDAGIKLKAPPAKFLAQYIENCSLENEDDEELIEWWSRLLVDAGTNYDAKHVFYANVLKQLSATELEILEVLVRNSAGSYGLKCVEDTDINRDFFSGSKLVLSDKSERSEILNSIKAIQDEFAEPGMLILEISTLGDVYGLLQRQHPDYRDDDLPSWQILHSLQLLRLEYLRFVSGSVQYHVRLATITRLGSKIYFACHDRDFLKKKSDEVRFKRSRKSNTLDDFSHLYAGSTEPKRRQKRNHEKKASKGTS